MAVTNLFPEENRERLNKEISIVKKEALKTPIQGIIAALEGMKIRKDRVQILKNAKFKKLLIIGLKDTVIQPINLINEAKNTNSEQVQLEGGHMSYIENENIFLQEIVHFIDFFNL